MGFLMTVIGFMSAVLGTLIHLPDRNEKLRPLQIAVNEWSWIPGILGLVAILGGLMGRSRDWVAILTGATGAALGAIPFMQYEAAAKDMSSAILAGLGENFEAEIPPPIRTRLRNSTRTFGKRESSGKARLWRDIRYAERDTRTLKLDVYQPLNEPIVGDHYPAIIMLHGGGWRHGDKGEAYFTPHHRYYASQGYVVFDIQYRLSGEAIWPAPLEDVQDAIRWVKEHADDYRVNAGRIALLGRSSGAHLALMAGYCPKDDTGVRAVVSIYAPIELRLPDLSPDSAIVGLMGGTYEDLPGAYESATPLNFVGDNLPPTMIIEAGMDSITPFFHGDRLVNALALTDTRFVLLRSPWSRHGFDAVPMGLGGQLVQYHLDRFLAWTLYRE